MDIPIINSEEKEKAVELLKKAKKYEEKVTLHKVRINEKTIVCCKNKNRLEDYKKLK